MSTFDNINWQSAPGEPDGGVTTRSTWRRRAHRAAIISCLVGLAILGAAALIVWSWRDTLPDPVATHWGLGGQPDGFSSLATNLSLLIGTGVFTVAAMSAIAWIWGRSTATRRISVGCAVGIATMLAIDTVGTLWGQRGLTDAAEAGSVDLLIALACGAALVTGALAAACVRRDPPTPATQPVPASASRVTMATTERVVWFQRIHLRGAVAICAGAFVLIVGLGVATSMWAFTPIGLILPIGLALFDFTVRVDPAGLTVRSILGWPRTAIPATEVVEATATYIDPFRDFGGWGWRVGRKGRTGVVLRRGRALLVEQTDGRSFVVTVDDADTAAALLNTYADQARPLR
jgi:hypothetical protein